MIIIRAQWRPRLGHPSLWSEAAGRSPTTAAEARHRRLRPDWPHPTAEADLKLMIME
jgi:hypothetical protein